MNAVTIRNSMLGLKELLYGIVMEASNSGTPDILGEQKMKVLLPSALKNNGNVINIQTQSIQVHIVVEKAVNGLKTIDTLLLDIVKDQEEPLLLEDKSEMSIDEAVEQCCIRMKKEKFTFKQAKDRIEKQYLETVIKDYITLNEASKVLGVSPQHLSKLVRTRKLEK